MMGKYHADRSGTLEHRELDNRCGKTIYDGENFRSYEDYSLPLLAHIKDANQSL